LFYENFTGHPGRRAGRNARQGKGIQGVRLGDLSEEFESRIETQGVAAAQRWYLREALRSAPHLVFDWWHHLDRRGAISVSVAAVGSLAAVFALENLLLVGISAMGDTVDWTSRMPPLGVACLMLLWTLVDGVFAGFVVAGLGTHESTLLAVGGATGADVMVGDQLGGTTASSTRMVFHYVEREH
jgi:hypothetical protein